MTTAGRSLVLIGFMGAGKSAVGRELASRLGWPRRDTDEMIQQKFAMKIPEIFAGLGEVVFRDAETEALRTLQDESVAIVVTGGGVVMRAENLRLLRALGRTFWLDADEEILWERASRRNTRPLLRTANPREQFCTLRRERMILYRAAADHRVDTSSSSIVEVATAILQLV